MPDLRRYRLQVQGEGEAFWSNMVETLRWVTVSDGHVNFVDDKVLDVWVPALTDTQRATALDELRMLHGDPPHNTWSNICYTDGIFARSLEERYGMSISELERETGYHSPSSEVR